MSEVAQDDGGGGPLLGAFLPLSQTYETWIFAIFGAFLVGLSGIFPLLVIPLESGPALKHGEPAKKLRLMLSFAVGSLLGDVFLHLLPEVWSHIDRDNHGTHIRIGLWIITGLLAFMIVEKLMGDEDEFEHMEDTCDEAEEIAAAENLKKKIAARESKQNSSLSSSTTKINDIASKSNKNSHNSQTNNKSNKTKGEVTGISEVPRIKRRRRSSGKLISQLNGGSCVEPSSEDSSSEKEEKGSSQGIKISGYLNLMANVVDNFTHGLAVAGSFCISTKVGLLTTVAILLHEIPHEVGDFAILLRSGFDRWKAAKAQFLTATGGVVGAITALSAESAQITGERTAWILPFTSGGFMYIALVTVVPDLLQEKHGWESLKQVFCICLGVSAMVCVTLLFD